MPGNGNREARTTKKVTLLKLLSRPDADPVKKTRWQAELDDILRLERQEVEGGGPPQKVRPNQNQNKNKPYGTPYKQGGGYGDGGQTYGAPGHSGSGYQEQLGQYGHSQHAQHGHGQNDQYDQYNQYGQHGQQWQHGQNGNEQQYSKHGQQQYTQQPYGKHASQKGDNAAASTHHRDKKRVLLEKRIAGGGDPELVMKWRFELDGIRRKEASEAAARGETYVITTGPPPLTGAELAFNPTRAHHDSSYDAYVGSQMSEASPQPSHNYEGDRSERDYSRDDYQGYHQDQRQSQQQYHSRDIYASSSKYDRPHEHDDPRAYETRGYEKPQRDYSSRSREQSYGNYSPQEYSSRKYSDSQPRYSTDHSGKQENTYDSRNYAPQPSYDDNELEPGEYDPHAPTMDSHFQHRGSTSGAGYDNPMTERRFEYPRTEERSDDTNVDPAVRERLKSLWHSQPSEPPSPAVTKPPMNYMPAATRPAPPTPVSPVFEDLASRISAAVRPNLITRVSEVSETASSASIAVPGPSDIQLYISGDVGRPTLSQAPPAATAEGRSLRGCGWIDVVMDGVERQAFVNLCVSIPELPATAVPAPAAATEEAEDMDVEMEVPVVQAQVQVQPAQPAPVRPVVTVKSVSAEFAPPATMPFTLISPVVAQPQVTAFSAVAAEAQSQLSSFSATALYDILEDRAETESAKAGPSPPVAPTPPAIALAPPVTSGQTAEGAFAAAPLSNAQSMAATLRARLLLERSRSASTSTVSPVAAIPPAPAPAPAPLTAVAAVATATAQPSESQLQIDTAMERKRSLDVEDGEVGEVAAEPKRARYDAGNKTHVGQMVLLPYGEADYRLQ